jgi:hypothetical protein
MPKRMSRFSKLHRRDGLMVSTLPQTVRSSLTAADIGKYFVVHKNDSAPGQLFSAQQFFSLDVGKVASWTQIDSLDVLNISFRPGK